MNDTKVKRVGARAVDTNDALRPLPRRKIYVKPQIISCSAEEILERLGSARACSFSGEVTGGGPTDEFGLPAH
jgi:hypothetical protein